MWCAAVTKLLRYPTRILSCILHVRKHDHRIAIFRSLSFFLRFAEFMALDTEVVLAGVLICWMVGWCKYGCGRSGCDG